MKRSRESVVRSQNTGARWVMAALVCWPVISDAQVICALGAGGANYKAAGDQRPSADALELTARANAAVKAICGTNCPQVVLFRNATAANLMLIADGGRAKVVYAPQVFTAAYDHYGDAGLVALLAHVLGHALDDAIGAAWIEKGWTSEVRADAWAGCMLAKASLADGDVLAALGALAGYPSPGHAGWGVRLAAVRSGYGHCGGKGALGAGTNAGAAR